MEGRRNVGVGERSRDADRDSVKPKPIGVRQRIELGRYTCVCVWRMQGTTMSSDWNYTLENMWNVSMAPESAIDEIYGNGNSTVTAGNGDDAEKRDFVFDRTDVRVIFISLYSLVFCGCFIGEYYRFF